MEIRPYQPGDEAAICAIYNHYVTHTVVTFEEEPVTEAQMRERIDACVNTGYPWYVCVEHGQVLGYAYASRWKQRAAYRHTAESSVYLRHDCARRGLGRALYEVLLPDLRARGCHVVLACIALPHEASVGLHERMGFTPVAHFAEVGRKFDCWLDVGYWQLIQTP